MKRRVSRLSIRDVSDKVGRLTSRTNLENTRAYDILALTLQRHGKLITTKLHTTLLRLAGVDEPDLSVVSSAPAIDNLICDFRLWSASSPAVQRQHIAMVASLVQAEAGAVNVKKLRKCGEWLAGKGKPRLLPDPPSKQVSSVDSSMRSEAARSTAK